MGVGKTVQTNEQALASDINSMAGWGAIGARPATEDVLAGSFYFDTTNSILYQEQNGSWVAVLQIKTLNPANETVEAGYYAATTLSAVDADLAVGNIKKDVNIFGFLGTLPSSATIDVLTSARGAVSDDVPYRSDDIAAGGDYTLVTTTPTFDASCIAIASGLCLVYCTNDPTAIKIRLFMGGVQRAESGYIAISSDDEYTSVMLQFAVALSGAQVCSMVAHNYGGGSQTLYQNRTEEIGDQTATGLFVASVKVV